MRSWSPRPVGSRRLALVLALGALAACTVDRRSEQFRCTASDPCDDGRRCQDGWCVLADPADAGPDAFVCPAVCDSCAAGVCIVECGGSSDCAARVVCPPGLPCRVRCDGNSSCAGGVDCRAATVCDIECVANGACQGMITCGDGACRVTCTLNSTCTGGVDCRGACACDVMCAGVGACVPEALCPPLGEMCDTGAGCRSAPQSCDTCT